MERDKQTKRQRERKEREGRRREECPLQIFNTEFFSLSLSLSRFGPPALRTLVFDVAKLSSMLRDALDEVSGLETTLVTARARVRRNETPFSFEAFSSKKFLSEHPFP